MYSKSTLALESFYSDSGKLFETLCAKDALFYFFNLSLFVSSSQQSLLGRPQCAVESLIVKYLESSTAVLTVEKKDKVHFFPFFFPCLANDK